MTEEPQMEGMMLPEVDPAAVSGNIVVCRLFDRLSPGRSHG